MSDLTKEYIDERIDTFVKLERLDERTLAILQEQNRIREDVARIREDINRELLLMRESIYHEMDKQFEMINKRFEQNDKRFMGMQWGNSVSFVLVIIIMSVYKFFI